MNSLIRNVKSIKIPALQNIVRKATPSHSSLENSRCSSPDVEFRSRSLPPLGSTSLITTPPFRPFSTISALNFDTKNSLPETKTNIKAPTLKILSKLRKTLTNKYVKKEVKKPKRGAVRDVKCDDLCIKPCSDKVKKSSGTRNYHDYRYFESTAHNKTSFYQYPSKERDFSLSSKFQESNKQKIKDILKLNEKLQEIKKQKKIIENVCKNKVNYFYLQESDRADCKQCSSKGKKRLEEFYKKNSTKLIDRKKSNHHSRSYSTYNVKNRFFEQNKNKKPGSNEEKTVKITNVDLNEKDTDEKPLVQVQDKNLELKSDEAITLFNLIKTQTAKQYEDLTPNKYKFESKKRPDKYDFGPEPDKDIAKSVKSHYKSLAKELAKKVSPTLTPNANKNKKLREVTDRHSSLERKFASKDVIENFSNIKPLNYDSKNTRSYPVLMKRILNEEYSTKWAPKLSQEKIQLYSERCKLEESAMKKCKTASSAPNIRTTTKLNDVILSLQKSTRKEENKKRKTKEDKLKKTSERKDEEGFFLPRKDDLNNEIENAAPKIELGEESKEKLAQAIRNILQPVIQREVLKYDEVTSALQRMEKHLSYCLEKLNLPKSKSADQIPKYDLSWLTGKEQEKIKDINRISEVKEPLLEKSKSEEPIRRHPISVPNRSTVDNFRNPLDETNVLKMLDNENLSKYDPCPKTTKKKDYVRRRRDTGETKGESTCDPVKKDVISFVTKTPCSTIPRDSCTKGKEDDICVNKSYLKLNDPKRRMDYCSGSDCKKSSKNCLLTNKEKVYQTLNKNSAKDITDDIMLFDKKKSDNKNDKFERKRMPCKIEVPDKKKYDECNPKPEKPPCLKKDPCKTSAELNIKDDVMLFDKSKSNNKNDKSERKRMPCKLEIPEKSNDDKCNSKPQKPPCFKKDPCKTSEETDTPLLKLFDREEEEVPKIRRMEYDSINFKDGPKAEFYKTECSEKNYLFSNDPDRSDCPKKRQTTPCQDKVRKHEEEPCIEKPPKKPCKEDPCKGRRKPPKRKLSDNQKCSSDDIHPTNNANSGVKNMAIKDWLFEKAKAAKLPAENYKDNLYSLDKEIDNSLNDKGKVKNIALNETNICLIDPNEPFYSLSPNNPDRSDCPKKKHINPCREKIKWPKERAPCDPPLKGPCKEDPCKGRVKRRASESEVMGEFAVLENLGNTENTKLYLDPNEPDRSDCPRRTKKIPCRERLKFPKEEEPCGPPKNPPCKKDPCKDKKWASKEDSKTYQPILTSTNGPLPQNDENTINKDVFVQRKIRTSVTTPQGSKTLMETVSDLCMLIIRKGENGKRMAPIVVTLARSEPDFYASGSPGSGMGLMGSSSSGNGKRGKGPYDIQRASLFGWGKRNSKNKNTKDKDKASKNKNKDAKKEKYPWTEKDACLSKKPKKTKSNPECNDKSKDSNEVKDPYNCVKERKSKKDDCKEKPTAVDPCNKDKKDPCKSKPDPCKKKEDSGICKDIDKAISGKKDQLGEKTKKIVDTKKESCRDVKPPPKKEDPCKKKDNSCTKKGVDDFVKKREDPCKPKDPCKKKEDPCKNKEDPCKKKEDPCKKKEDPCKKKDDPCKKKEDPCKKKEDPCKKKDDPCKKKEDPCKKKEDPCKKKEDPCKKKEDPCKKKEDPCKKKEDPCKKKEDPCKKKDDDFCNKKCMDPKTDCLKKVEEPSSKLKTAFQLVQENFRPKSAGFCSDTKVNDSCIGDKPQKSKSSSHLSDVGICFKTPAQIVDATPTPACERVHETFRTPAQIVDSAKVGKCVVIKADKSKLKNKYPWNGPCKGCLDPKESFLTKASEAAPDEKVCLQANAFKSDMPVLECSKEEPKTKILECPVSKDHCKADPDVCKKTIEAFNKKKEEQILKNNDAKKCMAKSKEASKKSIEMCCSMADLPKTVAEELKIDETSSKGNEIKEKDHAYSDKNSTREDANIKCQTNITEDAIKKRRKRAKSLFSRLEVVYAELDRKINFEKEKHSIIPTQPQFKTCDLLSQKALPLHSENTDAQFNTEYLKMLESSQYPTQVPSQSVNRVDEVVFQNMSSKSNLVDNIDSKFDNDITEFYTGKSKYISQVPCQSKISAKEVVSQNLEKQSNLDVSKNAEFDNTAIEFYTDYFKMLKINQNLNQLPIQPSNNASNVLNLTFNEKPSLNILENINEGLGQKAEATFKYETLGSETSTLKDKVLNIKNKNQSKEDKMSNINNKNVQKYEVIDLADTQNLDFERSFINSQIMDNKTHFSEKEYEVVHFIRQGVDHNLIQEELYTLKVLVQQEVQSNLNCNQLDPIVEKGRELKEHNTNYQGSITKNVTKADEVTPNPENLKIRAKIFNRDGPILKKPSQEKSFKEMVFRTSEENSFETEIYKPKALESLFNATNFFYSQPKVILSDIYKKPPLEVNLGYDEKILEQYRETIFYMDNMLPKSIDDVLYQFQKKFQDYESLNVQKTDIVKDILEAYKKNKSFSYNFPENYQEISKIEEFLAPAKTFENSENIACFTEKDNQCDETITDLKENQPLNKRTFEKISQIFQLQKTLNQFLTEAFKEAKNVENIDKDKENLSCNIKLLKNEASSSEKEKSISDSSQYASENKFIKLSPSKQLQKCSPLELANSKDPYVCVKEDRSVCDDKIKIKASKNKNEDPCTKGGQEKRKEPCVPCRYEDYSNRYKRKSDCGETKKKAEDPCKKKCDDVKSQKCASSNFKTDFRPPEEFTDKDICKQNNLEEKCKKIEEFIKAKQRKDPPKQPKSEFKTPAQIVDSYKSNVEKFELPKELCYKPPPKQSKSFTSVREKLKKEKMAALQKSKLDPCKKDQSVQKFCLAGTKAKPGEKKKPASDEYDFPKALEDKFKRNPDVKEVIREYVCKQRPKSSNDTDTIKITTGFEREKSNQHLIDETLELLKTNLRKIKQRNSENCNERLAQRKSAREANNSPVESVVKSESNKQEGIKNVTKPIAQRKMSDQTSTTKELPNTKLLNSDQKEPQNYCGQKLKPFATKIIKKSLQNKKDLKKIEEQKYLNENYLNSLKFKGHSETEEKLKKLNESVKNRKDKEPGVWTKKIVDKLEPKKKHIDNEKDSLNLKVLKLSPEATGGHTQIEEKLKKVNECVKKRKNQDANVWPKKNIDQSKDESKQDGDSKKCDSVVTELKLCPENTGGHTQIEEDLKKVNECVKKRKNQDADVWPKKIIDQGSQKNDESKKCASVIAESSLVFKELKLSPENSGAHTQIEEKLKKVNECVKKRKSQDAGIWPKKIIDQSKEKSQKNSDPKKCKQEPLQTQIKKVNKLMQRKCRQHVNLWYRHNDAKEKRCDCKKESDEVKTVEYSLMDKLKTEQLEQISFDNTVSKNKETPCYLENNKPISPTKISTLSDKIKHKKDVAKNSVKGKTKISCLARPYGSFKVIAFPELYVPQKYNHKCNVRFKSTLSKDGCPKEYKVGNTDELYQCLKNQSEKKSKEQLCNLQSKTKQDMPKEAKEKSIKDIFNFKMKSQENVCMVEDTVKKSTEIGRKKCDVIKKDVKRCEPKMKSLCRENKEVGKYPSHDEKKRAICLAAEKRQKCEVKEPQVCERYLSHSEKKELICKFNKITEDSYCKRQKGSNSVEKTLIDCLNHKKGVDFCNKPQETKPLSSEACLNDKRRVDFCKNQEKVCEESVLSRVNVALDPKKIVSNVDQMGCHEKPKDLGTDLGIQKSCMRKVKAFKEKSRNVEENDQGLLRQCAFVAKKLAENKTVVEDISDDTKTMQCGEKLVCKVVPLGVGEKLVCTPEEPKCYLDSDVCQKESEASIYEDADEGVIKVLNCSIEKDDLGNEKLVCRAFKVPEGVKSEADLIKFMKNSNSKQRLEKVTSNKLVCREIPLKIEGKECMNPDGTLKTEMTCKILKVEEIRGENDTRNCRTPKVKRKAKKSFEDLTKKIQMRAANRTGRENTKD